MLLIDRRTGFFNVIWNVLWVFDWMSRNLQSQCLHVLLVRIKETRLVPVVECGCHIHCDQPTSADIDMGSGGNYEGCPRNV